MPANLLASTGSKAVRTGRATLTAVVAVAVLVAGCGDEGESTGSDQAAAEPRIGLPVFVNSLAKAEYLKEANKLCRISWADMLQEFDRYRRERGSREGEGDLFAYVSRQSFLPHMQFWFDDISYLGAPKGDREEVEDMLKALQWAVFSGAELRIGSPGTMAAVFSSFNRLAREYELNDCLVEASSF